MGIPCRAQKQVVTMAERIPNRMRDKSGRRNGEIDFLRSVFAIIIVLHHSRFLVGDQRCLFLGGSLAVEFFFIVSGYLMMASVQRACTAEQIQMPLGKETRHFLAKKLGTLLPELLIAQVIAFLFTCFAKRKSVLGGVLLLTESFWDLSLFRMTGLLTGKMNGCTWYISSMLLCMAILYPLLRKYKDMMVNVILPVVCLLGMGFLCRQYGNPRDPSKWIGWTFKGNIRAFCELSLGAVAYAIAEWFGGLSLNGRRKLAVTMAELSFYAVYIYYMYAKKASEKDFFFILLLFIAIIITFSEQSMLCDMFRHRFFHFLGQFSLSLYLSHLFYAQHLKKVLPALDRLSVSGQIMIYITVSLLTATAVYLLACRMRKNNKKNGE